MLNRRLLRARVMQALYALKQSENSNFHQAHEYIKEIFSPDLNSMEVQDPIKIEKKRKEASELFDKNFLSETASFDGEAPEIQQAVNEALKNYKAAINKDKTFFRNLMVDTTTRLSDTYILCLLFPLDFIHFIASGQEVKHVSKIFGKEYPEILQGNKIIRLLKENKIIQDWKIRKNLNWDQEVLKKILLDAVGTDEAIRTQLTAKPENFEEQKEQMLQVFKKLFFKNEAVLHYFDESEVNWVENKSVIKSMVLKTVKAVEEQSNDIEVLELSSNWEEDKEFFIELYNSTIEHDRYLEEVISKKTQHWDIERVAALDKIILKMALTEMIQFPSIPVKVSINEYIELSKVYSTPKSKQFINGILDKISGDLINEGVVKKSGRGLIDNK